MSDTTQRTAGVAPAGASGGSQASMLFVVVALGITQITAWGTSYYSLGVMAQSIGKEFGWSRGFVFLGFSISVLVMALISAAVGRLIDRIGARLVMTVGSAIVALGLLLLAHVHVQWEYLAAWALIGVGMRCSLYDAAFAALVQVVPERGRQAISYLTLFGAFASSVFWVVGHYLDESVGWRQTFMIFALLNLVVCLPLHWLSLSRRHDATGQSAAGPTARGDEAGVLEGSAANCGDVVVRAHHVAQRLRLRRRVGATRAHVGGGGTGSRDGGLDRLAEGRRPVRGPGRGDCLWPQSQCHRRRTHFDCRRARRVRAAYMSGGNFGALLAFTLMMGASQGVLTIVRGAVPLALFGTRGYGAVLGFIATPVLLVSAAAPTVFAAIVDRWGWPAGNLAILVSAGAAFLCMEAMARWHRSGAGASGPR